MLVKAVSSGPLLSLAVVVLLSVRPFELAAHNAYVATTGSDTNPGTEASPYRTIRKALENVGAGDTVYIRGGVYDEFVRARTQRVPSGTSWDNAVTVRGYPGETVRLRHTGANQGLILLNGNQYTIWKDLILDAGATAFSQDDAEFANTIGLFNGSNYNRFENIEVVGSVGTGVDVSGAYQGNPDNHHNEFINLRVHDGARSNRGHGFYIRGNYNLVDGCEVYNYTNTPGGGVSNSTGIAVYDDGGAVTGNIVRNCRIHDNRAAFFMGSGPDNMAYNNLIYDNAHLAVEIGYSTARRIGFFNNTVVGHPDAHAVTIHEGSQDTQVVNNIFWGNAANDVRDLGSGTTSHTNLSADPGFVDAQSKDFRLAAGSRAIDAGVTLPEVPVDMNGVARPQGAAADIGAIEYGEASREPSQGRARAGVVTVVVFVLVLVRLSLLQ